MASIPRVNRGDLITDLGMNQVIDLLNELVTRVTKLEGSGPTGQDQVVITALEPPTGKVRIGEDLTIRGRNFGHSAGRLRVFIDEVAVNNFNRPGTNDETIIITVPQEVGSPPLGGTAAQLTVSNSITSAERTLTLLPFGQLIGTVPMILRRTEPVTPAANAPFDLFVRMEARLSREAVVKIDASVTGITATPQILTDARTALDPLRPMKEDAVELFVVRVLIPPVAGAVNFTVTITATVEGTQRGVLAPSFTVGTPAEQPDEAIDLPIPTAASITNGAGSYSAGTLALGSGARGEITFSVMLEQAGLHTATATLEGAAAGWVATIFDNATFTIDPVHLNNANKQALRLVRLRVDRPNGAVAGSVRVRVRRATGNGTSQVITLALV